MAGIQNVVSLSKGGRGIGVGIDVQAERGFVVAPPSVLKSSAEHGAGKYQWIAPPMTPVFQGLPDWVVKMLPPAKVYASHARLERSATSATDVEGLAMWVSRVSKGKRNDCLYWAGERLVEAAVVAGLSNFEAVNTVDSGFRTSGLRYQRG